jgi:hypothetical protein
VVAPKDFNLPQHPQIETKNLFVCDDNYKKLHCKVLI